MPGWCKLGVRKMEIELYDVAYKRLCTLADERHTTPAQLARWWVERELKRQWLERAKAARAAAAETVEPVPDEPKERKAPTLRVPRRARAWRGSP
jgi:L-serine deaminase